MEDEMTQSFNTDHHNLWVKRLRIKMEPPSLKDNTGDADRLARSIKKELGTEKIIIPYSLIGSLPHRLRDLHYDCSVAIYEYGHTWNTIDIFSPDVGDRAHGIAMDLGSSTVVARLVVLTEAKVLEEISFRNPQVELGADILTRIHHAAQPGGLKELNGILIREINQQIARLCVEQNVNPDEIVASCVAGNTTMTHFFLNLDPYWICREPYIPVINTPGVVEARALGLGINPRAPVFVFPNVGSYFGGDLIAGIISSGMARNDDISLLVDVGTNAEVVIGCRDWLMGCAGAAGPALEGGVAAMGMMAGPGAIDRIEIDPATSTIKYHTIDEKPPEGICGSGFIDLVAQLYLAGMVDMRGKFVASRCGSRLIHVDGVPHLVVVEAEESATGQPIMVSQPDIDSLLRSKAAMYTILTTLTKTVGIGFAEISRFYVAGTFGSYINPRSAITIGMLPDLPLEKYQVLGNTSLEGVTLALSSKDTRDQATRVRDQITYLELNVNQEFMNLFSAAKFIPHTDPSLFPSVPPPFSQ